MESVRPIKTIAELKEFMKAEKFEYSADDMEMSEEGDLQIRIGIYANGKFLSCKMSSLGTILPTNNKFFREDCLDFLDNLESDESYKQFRKHVFGHLDGKDLCIVSFALYNRNTKKLAGEVIWNFDEHKLNFLDAYNEDD